MGEQAGTPNAPPTAVSVPAYLTVLFDVVGKIGEGTYDPVMSELTIYFDALNASPILGLVISIH